MSTRRRLSQLLLASHLGLVLLFALLLLATGVGTIRSAVVGQSRTEAQRAVSEARARLQEWRQGLSVAADLLAEHPTLAFHLDRNQVTHVRALLRTFRATSGVDYLRVEWDERVVAIGENPPSFTTGLAFDGHGGAWRIQRHDIPGRPGAWLVLADALADRLDTPSGGDLLAVRLEPLVRLPPVPSDPWRDTLHRVTTSDESTTVEDVGAAAAARIVILRDDVGAPRALLSASVQREWVRLRFFEWLGAFGGSLLATFTFAVFLAALLAARIARPFAQLAAQAEHLGGGDLRTPITRPKSFLAEPVALARSLEEMRAQVASLTAAERRQREELDSILDGVDEGIAGLDSNQLIHYANRQFLELVGRAREQVLGRPVQELISPIASESLSPAADDALPMLERYRAIGGTSPLTVRWLGDETRRVVILREENAVEVARVMRDRILANLSHEFQTPLSAQMASIELLRDHLRRGDDRVAIHLADAQFRGTLRLSQLVDNLLDSVRIESGEMRLRRKPVDIARVAEEAVELMQPLIAQRQQRVVNEIEPGPKITGDAQRLLSVIVNLLANANKFAPNRSVIRLGTQWLSSSVLVWVEDEGPGMPPAFSARDLFAPFRRAPDEDPGQRGTGLGLAIVLAIVSAHGGEVRIETLARPGGARIVIELPLRDADEDPDSR